MEPNPKAQGWDSLQNGGITRAEALETTPTVSCILFFEISEFSQENPRVGANPPVLSAAAKKSGTGARLQRRLVALEDVYRREGVAGEKRARGALGRRAPSEPAHRLVRAWVHNPAQLRPARWAHRARAEFVDVGGEGEATVATASTNTGRLVCRTRQGARGIARPSLCTTHSACMG